MLKFYEEKLKGYYSSGCCLNIIEELFIGFCDEDDLGYVFIVCFLPPITYIIISHKLSNNYHTNINAKQIITHLIDLIKILIRSL